MLPEAGMKIPAVTIRTKSEEGVEELETATYFAGRKIVMFAVPGAFTPTCSAKHLPGFIKMHQEFKNKGIDQIICIAANDPFVMSAWGKENNVGDKIIMIGDPFLNFIKAIGAEVDKSGRGMGIRSNRYTMLVEDMKVVKLKEEKETGICEISAAENFLDLV